MEATVRYGSQKPEGQQADITMLLIKPFHAQQIVRAVGLILGSKHTAANRRTDALERLDEADTGRG
jgi:hypothetical protein